MSRFFWPRYSPNLLPAKVAASSTARSAVGDTRVPSLTGPRRMAVFSGSTSTLRLLRSRDGSWRASVIAPSSSTRTSRFSTTWPASTT